MRDETQPTIGDVMVVAQQLAESQTQFRVEVMARFGRIEAKLSAIQDDISVNMGR
jgi:hypothetical protein